MHSNEGEAKTNLTPPRLIKFTASQELARGDEDMHSADEPKQHVTTVIWSAAAELFDGDQTAADHWLHSAAMDLDWQRPIDIMEQDAQQALDLMTRMDRGVYT
ncbi:antitoxin Xre/MbcA/ParS toxin-binding domain-containing protein [Vreelandella aquamarina]|nr:antitoxin Xre/MbcA/ParS toxin-binding domain-containing protein [Halomonas meridiana]